MPNFQKLDVYQRAIAFLAFALDCGAKIPRGHADIFDQLKRAAMSVPLNIGEAAGRTGKADAARTYAIARGSAMECAAIVDVLRVLGVIGVDDHSKASEDLRIVCAMLTKLCR